MRATIILPAVPVACRAAVLAALYPVLLLGLTAQQVLWPVRSGPLALGEVFAPYLFVPLLVLVPLAVWRGMGGLRILLAVCVGVFLLRFPPHLGSAPPLATSAAPQFTALAWNVRLGGEWAQIRPVLATTPAGIVALEESDGQGLHGDLQLARRYPTVLVQRAQGADGLTLLSQYPLRDHGTLRGPADPVPRAIWAQLDIGTAQPLLVVVVHPVPPLTFAGKHPWQAAYDPTIRDATLATIRGFVAPALRRGQPVLVLGDCNLTEREPAYTDLTQGLQDADRLAGGDLGLTWRPKPLIRQPLALLRIDYLFSSPTLVPLQVSTDCTPRGSDHCAVTGRFALRAT
ncbi:MAG TPA: endonuclease/exonuclease/phosphatase family protein [Chloroflexia bacterium]|nr:endonuclease/exonuclease/phosphatase family protein [Chloroflexia bacterium]